jgi:hypothetical protein
MKKYFVVLAFLLTIFSACFSLNWTEKLLAPEFTGELSNPSIRVVEKSDDVTYIEVDGIIYYIKSK